MKEHFSIRLLVGLAFVGATLVAPTSRALAAGDTAASRLHTRLAAAPVVAMGHVSRVQPFDHDRVRVIHFTVDRVVKGEDRLGVTGGALEIVEMRDRPAAPAILSGGDQAVVFLDRMRRGSYLDETLGPGRRWQAGGGSFGVIADADPTVVAEAARMIARLADQSRAPAATAGERAVERRAWIFDAISGRHWALVEDGAAGLSEIPSLAADLQPAEQTRLETAARRDDLPPRVRSALIRAIGDTGLTALAPTLAALTTDSPEVLAASWRAQSQLGAPPRSADVARHLRDANPEARAVAARAYIDHHRAEAIPAVGRFLAGESEPEVRIAVLEALGPTENEEALRLIETAFVEDGDLAVRQAAGRVLFERGGDTAAASFGRLAFEAAPEGQRHAVALYLALDRPKDDPTLATIRTHPDPKVRELVEHGFADPHH